MIRAALAAMGAAFGIALLTLAGPATAQTFPAFSGLVVDAAGVLPPETKVALTQKLEALQRDTNRQLVVATIADTGGRPLEDYGYRLGRAWGVGLKDADNGAILFVAPGNPAGQRGPRLEVGRGLESILTDAFAESVTQGQMVPILRADGDVARAMSVGTDAVIAQLRASPEEARAKVEAATQAFDRANRRGASGGGAGIPIALVFMIGLFAVLAIPLFRGRRKRAGPWGRSARRHRGGGFDATDAGILLWTIGNALSSGRGGGGWSGGGGGSFGGGSDGSWGGGGFTGGGGGDFGGGGASGDW